MTTTTNPPPAQAGEAPEKIWISAASLPQSKKDGVGSFYPNFSGDPSRFSLIEYVRADLPRATGETGLTVEACLAELREMFPPPHDLRVALSDYGLLVTAEIYRDARLIGTGKTLKEAMENLKRGGYAE